MSAKTLIGVAVATFVLGTSATATAAACCDHEKKACCDKQMACCKHETNDAFAVLIPSHEQARPVRETMLVKFWDPVRVGDRILMGKYIIEHDTDRMARGEPCTHIYEVGKPTLPVVAFHCTHLTRPRADRPTVALITTGDPIGIKKLTECQFTGEAAAHGVPAR